MSLAPSQLHITRLQFLAGLVLLGMSCYLFACYSLRLTLYGHVLAPLWFPTSVMTIMFFHWPVRYWVAIALSATTAILIACFTFVPAVVENLWLTLINVVEALVAATLLRGLLPRENPLATLNLWLRMAFCCGIAAPLTGVILMLSLPEQPVSWNLTSVWLLSESIPALALVPVGLLFRRNYFSSPASKPIVFECVFTLIVTLALSVIALLWMPWPFAFIIVLLMWSAIRLPRMAAFLVFLSTLIVVSAVMGMKPVLPAFSDPRRLDSTSWLPFLLILLPANIMSIVMYAFRCDSRRTAESEIRFRNAMEYSAIGMALVSTEGRWLQVNRALCRFLDYSAEQLEQLTFQEITWHEDLNADLQQLARLQRDEIQSFSMEKRYITGQGRVVWGRMSASVVRHRDRSPNYYITQIEDITELKLSERTNQRLMERITLANEAGGIGIWEWDLKKDTLGWDKRMFEIYELEWRTQPSYTEWRSRIIEEDLPDVDLAISRVLGSDLPLELEFRIRLESGIRHIRSLARRVKDPTRDIDRLLGINIDITELKQLNDALFQEKERLHITLTSIGEAVICIDPHQRITFMNPVAEKLVGWRQEEALGLRAFDVVRLTNGANGPSIAEINQPQKSPQTIEEDVMLHSRQGVSYDIHYSITPLNALNGKQQGWVMVIYDVSESRKMLRQLSYNASHDSLTGLANRVSFENALTRILGSIKDNHHALLFIDLDRFKAVNDNAGHAAGDSLLREVAELMQSQTRPGDVLARLGGDEFGLVLPNCEPTAARAIAERIVTAIQHYQLQWQGKSYSIGASAGLTFINKDNRVASELLSQADIACYNSKRGGRGRVSIFEHNKQAALASELPSLATRLELIAATPVSFAGWPVVYPQVPEAAGFWLIDPHIAGLDSGELTLTALFSQADRHILEQARDQRVFSEFFSRYANSVAARGISVALPLSLSTLNHRAESERLFRYIRENPLPPQLLHIVLYGDLPLQQPLINTHIAHLKNLGCVLIYHLASRDPEIFNTLPHNTFDYLLLDSELTGNLENNLMDEVMVTILQRHAQRLHIRTIAGAAHNPQTVEILTGIGITMIFGESIARQRSLDNLLDVFLFGIH